MNLMLVSFRVGSTSRFRYYRVLTLPSLVYENPLVTATSREMILDIHNLTRLVADVEVARPRALLSWLFGWGGRRNEPAWFDALKCWSEIGDIVADSESWGMGFQIMVWR
jgi:hypothetical protein